jgi:hypothetical protein
MKQTRLNAIRNVAVILLRELQKTPFAQEGHRVYQRNPAGHWHGAFVPRSSGYSVLTAHENLIDQVSNELSPVLNADYPDHMAWIGFPGAAAGIMQPRMIIVAYCMSA